MAEFLVRNGNAKDLLHSLKKAPLRPALTRLLRHIEEMIALDYRLFSDEDYDELALGLSELQLKLAKLGRGSRISDALEVHE